MRHTLDLRPMQPPTHLLYLHGFRSSPQSTKALRMARWVHTHCPELVFARPQLPASPADTLQMLRSLVTDWPRQRMAVMGSSLGGFYATALAQEFDCPAVLLNPAIEPARDLARHIGEHACWHHPEERFFFAPEFVEELRAIQDASIPSTLTRPQRYFAIIAKGDEVLDWHEMLARYERCQVLLLEGSDHGLSNFEELLPPILNFLHLKS